MYKAIESIQKLRDEKKDILRSVYRGDDLNAVFERQRELGSMSLCINTDVANAVIPALKEDNVGNIVWSNISLRLDMLSFVSVPSVYDIQDKYKEEFNINGEAPKSGEKTEVKIPQKGFWAALTAQGIIVPLILNTVGGTKTALVKILCGVNAGAMVIEVIKYFDFLKPKRKSYVKSSSINRAADSIDYKPMYEEAIKAALRENNRILDDWFNRLETIAKEEIDKALGKAVE